MQKKKKKIKLSALLFVVILAVRAQVEIDWDLIAKYEKKSVAVAKGEHKVEDSSFPYEALYMGAADTPWMGGMQLISVDPLSGLFIWRLRSSPGFQAQLHRHYGEVYAVTEEGCWGYLEHPNWLACQGDLVHETPGSVHTYYIPSDQPTNTTIVIMTWGALENLDADGNTDSITDWRSMVRMYEAYCASRGLNCVDPIRARNKQDTQMQKACPAVRDVIAEATTPLH